MTTIWTALSKAQAEMKNAHLNCVNPHFKSKYADLASIRDTVIPVLTKHGLALTQTTQYKDGGLVLHTTLWGPDGAKIESTYPLPIDKPWVMGSHMTYARRYTLAAIVGLSAEEDDDANAAQDAARPKPPQKKAERVSGEPAMIPVPMDEDDVTDWKTWCSQFITTIEAEVDPERVKAWVRANDAPLGNLVIATDKKRGNYGREWCEKLKGRVSAHIEHLIEERTAA